MDQLIVTPVPPKNSVVFPPAKTDKFNTGKIKIDGSIAFPNYAMYVDDKIYADISPDRIRLAIRAAITANDTVLGAQDPNNKPDATDFEKLTADPITFQRTLLGKQINTRTLIVSLPIDKRVALHKTLTSTWNARRKSFTILEASQLAGTLINAVQCCRWGNFAFLSFMSALNRTISSNYRSLLASHECQSLLDDREKAWTNPEAI
jgi:hypothetical protein